MKKRLTFKPLENLKIDFLEVMSQFNTETVITEVEYAGTFSRTPDNHFHKLLSGNKIYYIYEVDYISSLKDEVGQMKKILGPNIKLMKVKKSHPGYKSPLAEYISDYSGSKPFYHKFLIESVINKGHNINNHQ